MSIQPESVSDSKNDVILFQSKLGLNANEQPDSLPTRDTGGMSGQKKLAKQL